MSQITETNKIDSAEKRVSFADKLILWLGFKNLKQEYKDELRNLTLLSDELMKRHKETEQKLKSDFDYFIRQYHAAICYQCKRATLAHYGGYYRDMHGHVFCGGECLDNYLKSTRFTTLSSDVIGEPTK